MPSVAPRNTLDLRTKETESYAELLLGGIGEKREDCAPLDGLLQLSLALGADAIHPDVEDRECRVGQAPWQSLPRLGRPGCCR